MRTTCKYMVSIISMMFIIVMLACANEPRQYDRHIAIKNRSTGTVYNIDIRVQDKSIFRHHEVGPSIKGRTMKLFMNYPTGILEVEWECPKGVKNYRKVDMMTFMPNARNGNLSVIFIDSGDNVKYEWLKDTDLYEM